MVWELEDNPLNPQELKIYRYVLKQSGSKNLATTVSRFIELRDYLDKNKFNSPEELRANVLSNGTPLFHPTEAKQLFKLVSSKTGGGPQPNVELIDHAIHQLLGFLYEWQPGGLADLEEDLSPYIFIAKTLEQNPEFGPLLEIAMDSVSAILPTIATTLQNLTPEVIGFLPIPEAGPIGAIIGWMIASIFVGLSMLLHISRAHFGQAFIVSFLLIPFLGTSLYNAALSGERFLEKIVDKRQRLLDTIEKTFGDEMRDTVAVMIPDISKGGSKRLSRKKHSKSKWRTQRKSKM